MEIINDAEIEGSEQFSITITDSSATAQSVSLQNMANIAIIDNDFGRYLCIYYSGSLLHVFPVDVTVGFSSLEFTVEEDGHLLEVCLRVVGSATLSQASLVRVKTLPGSAEGIFIK